MKCHISESSREQQDKREEDKQNRLRHAHLSIFADDRKQTEEAQFTTHRDRDSVHSNDKDRISQLFQSSFRLAENYRKTVNVTYLISNSLITLKRIHSISMVPQCKNTHLYLPRRGSSTGRLHYCLYTTPT